MAIRYLGSKSRISKAILALIGLPTDGRFVDPFCGMGSISREAATLGWSVRANDLLPSAAAMTLAQLTTRREVPFRHFGGYETAVGELNRARPRDGYFTTEYAPSKQAPTVRSYFTVTNARRIDGMRSVVANWNSAGLLTATEHQLILADLMEAINAVANTAGTYGCFLREFDPRALKPIEVTARTLLQRPAPAVVTTGDAVDVETTTDDVVYLDPPYTKRQYAAYYHILETIAAGDSPDVRGVTGLRPWRDRSSRYCHKTVALSAMQTLLSKISASRIFISYSTEGHVRLDEMVQCFSTFGRVAMHNVASLQRYAPNATSAKRDGSVQEVIIEIHRAQFGKNQSKRLERMA